MNIFTDPKGALAAIEALDKFGINLGLERISAGLSALGNPQLKYPVIHVGGTNGKGSTCAILAKALELSGFKVGLYTSPPLENFGERIRINGAEMDEYAVPSILERVVGSASSEPLAAEMTQFEIITAMAFEHFAREKVDVAIVEVGMGGRLDSTNAVAPVVTAITNVGLDHSEHLGERLRDIAFEKAGIAKKGVPMCTSAVGEALEAIRERCLDLGAPLKVLGEDFSFSMEAGAIDFKGERWSVNAIDLALPGAFQRKNLSLAASILETLCDLGWEVSPGILKEAAAEVSWPGRMELFGAGPRVLVDGAHNPHAAAALAESLGEFKAAKGELHLVLGVLGDKDAANIVEILAPLADRITLTRSASVRALTPEELGEVAARYTATDTSPDLSTALDGALALADSETLIVTTGSLTIVSEARAWLVQKGWLG